MNYPNGILTDIHDTILGTIIARKVQEVSDAAAKLPLSEVQALAAQAVIDNPSRGFSHALAAKIAAGHSAVIAEIKKASPSKGIIRADFNPAELAVAYQAGGAACLSVLTDVDFFKGLPDYLPLVRSTVDLPVIRKDFMINHYHIAQSRAMGADAVLLIAACLDDVLLSELYSHASELGMSVLMEVHNQAELERVLRTNNTLIGINNRNLKTFEVDLNNTLALLPMLDKQHLLVTESGIMTPADVALMRAHNVNAYLVGESLMRQANVTEALSTLFA